MPFSEGSSSPNVDLDTASIPKVLGPHDPPAIPALDGEMTDTLRHMRDQAMILRDAHQSEVEFQARFHHAEIERHDRVVRACNSALHELEPSQEGNEAVGAMARAVSQTTQGFGSISH